MLLWITIAVLTACALAVVLWPIMRGARLDSASGGDDIAVYKDQLEEIDADVARGLIGETEADAARTEISRRLLGAAAAGDEAKRGKRGRNIAGQTPVVAAVLAAVSIPLLSLSLYLAYGSPDRYDEPLAARLSQPEASQDIAALIGKVEARLREHPEDGRGWDVIAPVYMRMRRYGDAADAYARAIRLEGESTARLTGHGESLVLANDGIVSEQARRSFEKAHARDKSLAKPRFWLAMAQEQDGQFAKAAQLWRAMLTEGAKDAPWRPLVEERLKRAESQSGTAVAARPPVLAPAPAKPSGEPGPSAEDVAAAQQMTASERGAMIKQMVAGLAQRLAEDGNDLKGWLRLVRAYTVLGERDKADAALRSARENFKGDDKSLADLSALAESLGL